MAIQLKRSWGHLDGTIKNTKVNINSRLPKTITKISLPNNNPTA